MREVVAKSRITTNFELKEEQKLRMKHKILFKQF
jgi:hypothetical protein